MINIDGTGPLPPGRLHELVTAVTAAETEDECDWLEWKSGLDLDSRPGQFALARAILGFANRDPATTTRPFGGTAYVLVGVEPGRIDGITPVDMAVLQPRLARYLGSPAPFWRHHYVTPVEAADRVVLLVEVPAPRPGEIGYPLANDVSDAGGKTTASGTLFIRRASKTERANYAEVQMLMARAARPAPQTKITDVGLKLFVVPDHTSIALDLGDASIEQWLERRRQAMLDATIPADVRRMAAGGGAGAARIISKSSQSVDAVIDETRDYVRGSMTAALFQQGYNGLTIHIDNPSDEHLADVEVTITLPAGCAVIDPAQVESAVLPASTARAARSAFPLSLDHLRTGPRQARVVGSRRFVSIGTKGTYTELIGAIPAQSSRHTCTIQLHVEPGPAEFEFEVAVRSPSLPGVVRWDLTTPVETSGGPFLDELVDPDPGAASRPRKFQPTHHHPHG